MRERRLAMAFVILAVACGGPDDGPLYTGSQQSGGAGGAGGSSGSTGGLAGAPLGGQAGASTGGASGGAAGDASGGSTASGGASGSSAGGSGGTGSGGVTGVGSGSCGSTVCAFAAGDACCIAQNVGMYCANESLNNPCECKGIGCDTTVIHCDGPEDCSGKICCAQKPFLSSTYDEVACVEVCQSDQVVGATRKIVCHPGGAPCPQNVACQPDPLLPPGYGTCATP